MLGDARSFVTAVPLPLILIRSNERIEAANDAAKELFGEGIEKRHYMTALRNPDLLGMIEACLRDGKTRGVKYLTSLDQQDALFRASARELQLEAGTGLLVSFEDISHLEQIGQMRRDFVANVSHELRTPLTALIGFIDTLKGPARNDAAARERFLGTMEAEAHRMNRLVGDLLSLSRVEAEARVRPTERVDPVELIRSTLLRLEPIAADAQVSLVQTFPETPFEIVADSDQFRQILTNLVENAVKYSGKGSDVSVTLFDPTYDARLRCEAVAVEVRDNGPGIDAFHLPRLTERFYRVDNHRSREMGGTGLGLAIVKHVVARHRGRMKIDSDLGQGTCITVILPVA